MISRKLFVSVNTDSKEIEGNLDEGQKHAPNDLWTPCPNDSNSETILDDRNIMEEPTPPFK